MFISSSFKKKKAKQGRSLGRAKDELNLAIERLELLQLCFASPSVYYFFVISGGKGMGQSYAVLLMGPLGSAVCYPECSNALCSNTVLPPCRPLSAGNSSECPPPGNAPDDTICVDMGKCKDGECIPFCEREKNLRSCACNGGWCGSGLRGVASALLPR